MDYLRNSNSSEWTGGLCHRHPCLLENLPDLFTSISSCVPVRRIGKAMQFKHKRIRLKIIMSQGFPTHTQRSISFNRETD